MSLSRRRAAAERTLSAKTTARAPSTKPTSAMQVLKQRVSRQLRGKKKRGTKSQLWLPFAAKEALPRQFWQRRFHDFNVWSHKKKIEKLKYMHFNPVMRGLVCDPKD
jgi:REP element-mobilizing transposase RayT